MSLLRYPPPAKSPTPFEESSFDWFWGPDGKLVVDKENETVTEETTTTNENEASFDWFWGPDGTLRVQDINFAQEALESCTGAVCQNSATVGNNLTSSGERYVIVAEDKLESQAELLLPGEAPAEQMTNGQFGDAKKSTKEAGFIFGHFLW